MVKSVTVEKSSYNRLIKSLQTQVFEAKHKIERTFVEMYWTVGQTIEQYLSRHGNTAPDGRNIYIKISEDINIDARTLNQAVVFYRAYPKLKYELPLSWSHYRYLSTIDSAAERRYWEKRVTKEHLSCHEMQRLIKAKRKDALTLHSGVKLSINRGVLYYYRLIKASFVNRTEELLLVDCGFANRILPPPATGKLDNKRIVYCEAVGDGYVLKLSRKTAKDIYTYKAVIERVIDADTLLANIDCGFGIWTRQRLRFKGIDAAEKNTLAGQAAVRAIETKLKSCPFVVVKTHKSDKYDRYLVDVFYLPKETDPASVAASGRFLNQEMLDEGLAEVWKG